MFSLKEKQFIAGEVEKIILSLKHPEMPPEKPMFKLHVDGTGDWSWADIQPNWTYNDSDQPTLSVWNESARIIMDKDKGD